MNERFGDRPPGRGRRRRGHGRSRQAGSDGGPVPLFKRCAAHFQPGDRKRGQEYYLEERVELEIAGTRARSRVAGAERPFYRVGVDWSRVPTERGLHAFCECQRFADGRPCKHLWATLLALGDAGPEHQPLGKDRLGLRRDRSNAWPELGVPPSEGRDAVDNDPRAMPRQQQRRPQRGRRGRERLDGDGYGVAWREQLASVGEAVQRIAGAAASLPAATTAVSGLRLLVNTAASLASGGLVLDAFAPPPGAGEGGKLKPVGLTVDEIEELLLPAGARGRGVDLPAVVTALPVEAPGRQPQPRRGGGKPSSPRIQRLRLPQQLYEPVLSHLCGRGILGWWDGRSPANRRQLGWDSGEPWRLALRLDLAAGAARLSGVLERNGQSVPLSAPVLILHAGRQGSDGFATALVLFPDTVARLVARPEEMPWIGLLRAEGEIAIPRQELEEALATLRDLPALPRLEAPEELQVAEERAVPQPRLVLQPDPAPAWMNPPLLAELYFRYDGAEVSAGDPRPAVLHPERRVLLRRDGDREHAALVRLLELGLKPVQSGQGHGLELAPRELPAVAEPLLAEGWIVEVHGRTLRPPSPPSLRVETGIDWFEVSGDVDFGGDVVALREMLAAVKRGDRFVQLEDGSQGLLPEHWMEAYDSLAKLSQGESEDGLRFLPSQALLVDALLAATPPQLVDEAFRELKSRLASFERIKPKKEPRGFGGELRSYQREGLGWLQFLREFKLGGVLADDMGLGKTVQVLALLLGNRAPSKSSGLPSLVVAPRSLVYNWVEEAGRFTPQLKVLEYAGPDRDSKRARLDDYDLVVTTYGTLRRDIGFLATREFDTVVLDEAQAIKNPASQSAKASRLLVAKNRLALTGTPIENHLGELGSLFEFINPGLLGRLHALDALSSGRAPSQQELALIARGIRPFILRRTKAQVLPDLPPKTEMVLHCLLGPEQRELYDKLRAAYQASLLEQVEQHGLAASTMQVLEALLRLRQVACHPGLVNSEWEEAGSAKLEVLFDQVSEVLEEGHKLLVFSQFTKLLAYVRRHFDGRQVPYAYLDGQTRDRAAQVERFQTDPGCNLFLVSLKAGGVGLNLTAAGYVYLLDPWWNPAVEAQAIDRAHRIGQTQPVFAYRMIARDTVEEKMLELQKSKRQLADAILEGEGSTLAELTADDLRLLLS